MATDKKQAPKIDNSDLVNYPNGRIKDNTGSGDGTPVNRLLYSDIHEFFAKLMRLAKLSYNALPDNETNGHQLVAAAAALAGKNDYVYSLSNGGSVVNIAIDLSIINDGECLLTKSGFNYATTQTDIKGTTPALYGVTVPSSFKNGDFVLLIKTGTLFVLQRLVDGSNLDVLVNEYNYLKAATDIEEFTGTTVLKATTPYTNQLAFARRVIGLDSGIFLASTLRNGLMSKEDKQLLAGLVNPVKNVGWFSGVDVNESLYVNKPVYGDVLSAVSQPSEGNASNYLITIKNQMQGNNYFVRTSIQSEGNVSADNNIHQVIFKIVSNTQFLIALEEAHGNIQSLKIHIEVVQI